MPCGGAILTTWLVIAGLYSGGIEDRATIGALVAVAVGGRPTTHPASTNASAHNVVRMAKAYRPYRAGDVECREPGGICD